jgi:hypothetical protein
MKSILLIVLTAVCIVLWMDDNAKKKALDAAQDSIYKLTDQRDSANNALQQALASHAPIVVAPAATPTWFQQKVQGGTALDQAGGKVTP